MESLYCPSESCKPPPLNDAAVCPGIVCGTSYDSHAIEFGACDII